jgi:hypothetical protein
VRSRDEVSIYGQGWKAIIFINQSSAVNCVPGSALIWMLVWNCSTRVARGTVVGRISTTSSMDYSLVYSNSNEVMGEKGFIWPDTMRHLLHVNQSFWM